MTGSSLNWIDDGNEMKNNIVNGNDGMAHELDAAYLGMLRKQKLKNRYEPVRIVIPNMENFCS